MGDIPAFMHLRARTSQSLTGIELRWQNFVFNINQIQGIAGNVFCDGGHGRYLFSRKSNHIFGQNVALLVMNAPGCVGRLGTRHNGFNTWQRQRRLNVDVDDACMGMGASKHFAMQHARQMNIPSIFGSP